MKKKINLSQNLNRTSGRPKKMLIEKRVWVRFWDYSENFRLKTFLWTGPDQRKQNYVEKLGDMVKIVKKPPISVSSRDPRLNRKLSYDNGSGSSSEIESIDLTKNLEKTKETSVQSGKLRSLKSTYVFLL